ncbi:eCIS core domain-containing protein [Limnospira fusiformis]|uniref:eCIS core domain-containing protein n=1 Tax=Limnospira fusiformis TaxID=54297 RepID=UPI00296E389E
MQAESKSPLHGRFQTLAQRDNPKNSTPQQPIQAKLTVGAVGDKYEQEADRVADVVVDRIQSPPATTEVQKQEEETLQQKPQLSTPPTISQLQKKEELSNTLQRESEEEEFDDDNDDVQMKPQTAEAGGEVSADFESSLRREKGGGQPLDENLQSQMGRAMGADLSGVRIHHNSPANQLNQSIQAKAFTTGKDIFFKQGEYQPESRGGQKLIAHELTHVVQQGGSQIQSKKDDNSTVATGGLLTLQRKTYTVKGTDNARDENDKSREKYNPGDLVEISDDETQHKIDPAGNNRWYRIKDSQPPRYIRATRLQLYGTYISDKKRVNSNDKALESQKDNIKQINELTKIEKRDYKNKKGETESKKMNLAEQIDLGRGFLTDEIVKAIKELSQIPKGKTYLSQNGFLTQEELEKVAKEKRVIGDWERYEEHDFVSLSRKIVPDVRGNAVLSPIHRMQIATYQKELGENNAEFRQTPGYLRYEAHNMKKLKKEYEEAAAEDITSADTKKKKEKYEGLKKEIYDKDTEMWEKALNNDLTTIPESNQEIAKKYQEQTDSAIAILKRVFIVLQHGLMYRDDQHTPKFEEWQENVAVALSHGGRVMINLPPLQGNDKEHEFIYWLLGGSSAQVQEHKPKSHDHRGADQSSDYYKAKVDTRIVSSHDVEVTQNSLKELKSNTFDFKGAVGATSTIKHYGMDIPLGGLGNEDMAGDVILPDGRHGHMYIYYRPPSREKPGSVLVGAETSRMAHTDVFGMYHDQRSAPAEVSPTGTSKAGRIGAEFGGRVVDYTTLTTDGKNLRVKDPDWLKQLKTAEENVQKGIITSKELLGKKLNEEGRKSLFGESIDKPQEMKKYIVKHKAHARDDNNNKKEEYMPGAVVEISDNQTEHKSEKNGEIWYRIKNSDPPRYIRATRLHWG